MLTHNACWLDRQGLQDIDDAIAVLDIQEAGATINTQAVQLVGLDGSRIIRRQRASLQVNILLAVREQNIPRRQAIIQRINRWARGGGYLEVSDRPGQRLRVTLDTPLTVSSALRWTQTLTLSFMAYERPYWESIQETAARFDAAASVHNGSLRLPGDAPYALAEAELTSAQGGTGDVTVAVGDTSITLENVSLAAGDVIRIGYDDSAVLRITRGEESLLAHRTARSSDDLLAVPGRSNDVRILAPVDVQATISARGCWL